MRTWRRLFSDDVNVSSYYYPLPLHPVCALDDKFTHWIEQQNVRRVHAAEPGIIIPLKDELSSETLEIIGWCEQDFSQSVMEGGVILAQIRYT